MRALSLVTLALALAGCGEEEGDDTASTTDPTDLEVGEFAATVSGDLDLDLAGEASIFEIAGECKVKMVDDDDEILLSVRGNSGERPAAETYTVGGGQEDFVGWLQLDGSASTFTTQYSTENTGTWTVTTSSAEEVAGTFTFEVPSPDGTAPGVVVTGAFRALYPDGLPANLHPCH